MSIPFGIILLLAFGAIIFGISKGIGNRQGRYLYSNRVRWIVAGYVAILLICAVVVTVNPNKDQADWKMIDIEDLEKKNQDLYNYAIAGKIDTVDSKFINEKWDLDYREQQLNIEVAAAEFLNTQIIVERKQTNDDKIEAIYYKTRTSVNGMDITNRTNPLRLELAGNTLSLMNPKKVTLEFSMFTNVFSVNQFTGEDSLFDHHSYISEGASILYLQIPKDLELMDKGDLNLQFVE